MDVDPQEPEIVHEIVHEQPWGVKSNADPSTLPRRQVSAGEIFQMDDDDPMLQLLPENVRDNVLQIKDTHKKIIEMQQKLNANLKQFTSL